ncbi:MAG: GNAT family N-acetyltransferase [Marinoscillum sp.]
MDNISIKLVEEDELPQLLEFARENFISTYGHMNSPENMEHYLRESFTIDPFTREFNHPGSSFFVLINSDNTIIGYYKLNIGSAQTERHYPESIEIERIYVGQKLKGKGLGRKMIHHAASQAKSRNLNFIWLGVWEKNPAAISFYKKLGFVEIDTHIFQLGTDLQTDIIMRLDVLSE